MLLIKTFCCIDVEIACFFVAAFYIIVSLVYFLVSGIHLSQYTGETSIIIVDGIGILMSLLFCAASLLLLLGIVQKQPKKLKVWLIVSILTFIYLIYIMFRVIFVYENLAGTAIVFYLICHIYIWYAVYSLSRILEFKNAHHRVRFSASPYRTTTNYLGNHNIGDHNMYLEPHSFCTTGHQNFRNFPKEAYYVETPIGGEYECQTVSIDYGAHTYCGGDHGVECHV